MAREVKQVLQRYKDLQDIIAILGIDELSEERQGDRRPRPQDRDGSSRSPSSWPSSSRGRRASTCRLPRRSEGFKEIVEGKHDEVPEQAFYMVGGIEEALQKAGKMKG